MNKGEARVQKMKSVKLSGDSLFERFVVRAVLLDTEVSVRLHSGTVVKGFITGIDQVWLQVTNGHNLESKLLMIDSIQEINRTEKRVSGLPKENKAKMKSMTHALRGRCQEISANNHRSAQVAK